MKRIVLILTLGLAALAGCNTTGTPTDHANACAPANDDQVMEFPGFIVVGTSTMCTKSGNGPTRCPFDVVANPGDQTGIIRAEIKLGDGSSEVENVEGKGFVVRDADGKEIGKDQKVKVTAQIKKVDREDKKFQNCYVVVKKIEAAQ